jgi:hypothetical protein
MAAIKYEQLVDLAEGRLPAAAEAALRQRIEADPAARAQLAAIRQLIAGLRAQTGADAPEAVIQRAVRLMPRPAQPQPVNAVRRLIVALAGQIWSAPQPAAGLRSMQTWPRALLLAAGDRELDLQVSPRGQGWQLIGQVLGPDEPGSVTLATHGRRVSASINELGEFVLPVVSAGRYTLTLTQGGLEVVVPALEVGVEPL